MPWHDGSVQEQPQSFTHRVHIHRAAFVPVCEDCGALSKMELIDITSFGAERAYLESPTHECPNGPHVVEHHA